MIGKDQIRKLVPHSGTMCLLDSVESWDDDAIVCISNTHRDNDNPLRRDNHLPAICIVEYAAQAMAVHGGLSKIDAANVGYLASIRNLQLQGDSLDGVDAPLRIEANKIAGDQNSLMYRFSAHLGDKEIASGRAAVILQPKGKVA